MSTTHWIAHDGGPCPVPEMTIVQVRFRDGAVDAPHAAAFYDGSDGQPDWWQGKEAGYEIAAYLVLEEAA